MIPTAGRDHMSIEKMITHPHDAEGIACLAKRMTLITCHCAVGAKGL